MESEKSRRSLDQKKVRYFHLKPSNHLNVQKLPRNKCILERYFAIQDELTNNSESKRSIALKIYNEIVPIYSKGPFPMKTKQKCIDTIVRLHEEYR